MTKISIIGNFGIGTSGANGQSIKTQILTKLISNKFGNKSICFCNTAQAKCNPVRFFLAFLKATLSKSIVILPAQGALKKMLGLMIRLKKVKPFFLHYFVVGGWLTDYACKDRELLDRLKKIDAIYVEIPSMKKQLTDMGMKNVHSVNKFSPKKPFKNANYVDALQKPIKLCFFARVSKEKGIEDLINAIQKVNSNANDIIYSLDIYGKIDELYLQRFTEIMKNIENYIHYYGIVDYAASNSIISKYAALVFPTFYSGEGYPNTIVDAYLAGVPVIANDWKYNKEIIRDGYDGLLYDRNNENELETLLEKIAGNPDILIKLQGGAEKRALEYEPENAISALLNNLQKEIE